MTANYHSKIRLLAAAAVVCGCYAYYACSTQAAGPPPRQDLSAFFQAIITGNVSEVERFLKSDVNVDVTDEKGMPPLVVLFQHLSYPGTRAQQVAIAKLLIDRGADVNGIVPRYGNPTHLPVLNWVILSENVDAVRLFLERGANPNGFKEAPLFTAAMKSSVPIAQLLIEHGANVNARDDFGQTPLFLVHDRGVARLLINSGADVNAVNMKGQSVLKVLSDPHRGCNQLGRSCIRVNKDVVALLQRHGAKLNP